MNHALTGRGYSMSALRAFGCSPGRNQVVLLAPAEPNVYRNRLLATTALQRSAMFSTMARNTCIRFAPLERGAVFGYPFSINISSPRDEDTAQKILLRKQEAGPLYYRETQQAPKVRGGNTRANGD